MREEDVPGWKPNVAERAGMAEDYILTSTKMIGKGRRQQPRRLFRRDTYRNVRNGRNV